MLSEGKVVNMLDEACDKYTRNAVAKKLGRVPKTITRWRTGQTHAPAYLLPALQDMLSKVPAESGQADFTFVDLFAGIGGIRLGFEANGGRCVFTSEWNEYSKKTYEQNFPVAHEIVGDIVKVLDVQRQIPDHDVLLAGFPCQPFSIAGVSKKNALGRPHGFECTTQGTLFFDVARIIGAKKPKAFLLENVKNLRSHDGGNTFRVILDVLEKELGYSVKWRIIDGKHFVPQHRERILIVGFREDNGFDFDTIKLPELAMAPRLDSVLHREDGSELDVDDHRYIDEKGNVHSKYTLSDKLWKYLKDYAEKHRAKGNGFGFGRVGREDTSRTLSARYYKDGSEILVKRGTNGNGRPRRLTPRECARLMGFPDTFKIPVSDTQAYRQFGNSVVVPVIRTVAAHMKPYIMALAREDEESKRQRKLVLR